MSGSTMRRTSSILCALREARTTRCVTATRLGVREVSQRSGVRVVRGAQGLRESSLLQAGELRTTGDRKVKQSIEQCPVERLALRCPLYLDELTCAGADDVHVGVRAHVF